MKSVLLTLAYTALVLFCGAAIGFLGPLVNQFGFEQAVILIVAGAHS